MAVVRLLGPSILLWVLLMITPPAARAAQQSEALLKLKGSFTGSSSYLDTWVSSSEPCENDQTWLGLVCYDGMVTGIRLGGMNLSGKIDVDALSEIPGLRTVSFADNAFSGSIPEFNHITALRAIVLSGNQFSGEIPMDYFANMGSLKKLWLSDNQFTGKIPSTLAQLTYLVELHLENNQFDGQIPLIDIPTLLFLNVSNNKLEGEIPPGLSKFDASSFVGNAGLCGEKLSSKCGNNGKENDQKNHKSNSSVIVSVVATIGSVILLALICFVLRMRRNSSARVQEADLDVLAVTQPNNIKSPVQKTSSGSNIVHIVEKKGMNLSRKGSNPSVTKGDLVLLDTRIGHFGMPDLMKASAEVLGNGGLGSSYKAVMTNGVAVVVKRIREANGKSNDEFDEQMQKLGKLRHPNILTPLAYHCRKDEKLLVYEYVPKGSLLYLLHGDRGPSHADLNWPARLKIIKGIARGIGYLHDELSPSDLPHGNLKSSNVLLGSDNEPLLSDYGIKPLISTPTVLQSLFAFKAPEAANYGLISPKCDVFCLGIMILEILTGKFPSQYLHNGKGGTDVVQWVVSAVSDGREAELFDPEISRVSAESLGEMEKLLRIGAACTESNLELRLGIKDAIKKIEEIEALGEAKGRFRKVVDLNKHIVTSQQDFGLQTTKEGS